MTDIKMEAPPQQAPSTQVDQLIVVSEPGKIVEHKKCLDVLVTEPIFHRFAAPLTTGTKNVDIFNKWWNPATDIVTPNKEQGASLFVPLEQSVFQKAHQYLEMNNPNEPPLPCFVHPNPSIRGKTEIFCDRVFPKDQPLAKHAYLWNIIPTTRAELQKCATCSEPADRPWNVCKFRGGGERLELPEFEDENLNCACQLLDMLIDSTNGFSHDTQFEAAYLAVYLHYNQQEFCSLADLAKFAGPYFLRAWPVYQEHPNPYNDDVFQGLFEAAECSSASDEVYLSRHSLSLFASDNAPQQQISVPGLSVKAPSKKVLEPETFERLLRLLLFASEDQLRKWNPRDGIPLDSRRRLNMSSAAHLSAIPVASLSIHVNDVPSAAIDLLLQRDYQFEGLISKLLAEVGANLHSLTPETVVVMSRSPEPTCLQSKLSFSFTILQCPAIGPDDRLDRTGGALASKLTSFLLRELNLTGEVQVLFQNSRPWYCPPLAPGLLPTLERAGFEYKVNEQQLFHPTGSCFFVVSSWFVGVHKYALHTVIAAMEMAKFSISQQFNFQPEKG